MRMIGPYGDNGVQHVSAAPLEGSPSRVMSSIPDSSTHTQGA